MMNHRPAERGVALILVLVLLPLVAIIMTQLSFETAIGDRLASSTLATQQFKLAIAARQRQMRLRLVRDLKDDEKAQAEGGAFDHYGDLWGPDSEGGKTAVQITKGDKDAGDEIQLYTEVLDEQGKFNLNLLLHKDAARAARALEVFRNLLDFYRDDRFEDVGRTEWDLTETEAQHLAERILHFLKGEQREGSVPLPQADLPDPTPEMAQGVYTVRDLLFADQVVHKKRVFERFTDVETGEVVPGLGSFVTIYGDGKVNVNTAPIQVLRAFFKEERGQREVAANVLHGRGGFLDTDTDQDAREDSIEERRQAEEEGRDEDAEPTAYKTLDDVSRVEGMDDGTFLRNNGIDVGRDFAVRSMFFTVTVTARREKAMRQQRCVFQRHSKGCLTWATEVRAVTAADLPEFLGEEE